jgi:hypothetical protein
MAVAPLHAIELQLSIYMASDWADMELTKGMERMIV